MVHGQKGLENTFLCRHNLYILHAVRCPYVRTSVTLGVASRVVNDVIMRIAGLVAGCERRRHNENDVMTIIIGLVADGTGRRYGDWRHVATGCNGLVYAGSSSY